MKIYEVNQTIGETWVVAENEAQAIELATKEFPTTQEDIDDRYDGSEELPPMLSVSVKELTESEAYDIQLCATEFQSEEIEEKFPWVDTNMPMTSVGLLAEHYTKIGKAPCVISDSRVY